MATVFMSGRMLFGPQGVLERTMTIINNFFRQYTDIV